MNDFDCFREPDESAESAPIQVDLYGFKLRSKPSPTEDAFARITLRGLLNDVSQSLLRICRDSFGLVADVFTGARSLVRGIAALPAAVASRISRAHQLSEQRELEAQESVSDFQITDGTKRDSVQQLEEILDDFRAQGIPVRIDVLPTGLIALSLVRPEHEEIAPAIAADALDAYIETLHSAPSQHDRTAHLLARRVADFELTVRSKNCLASLNIVTLGDLTKVSEAELLEVKNFGETSLIEIRELMSAHGLQIGQDLPPAVPKESLGAGEGVAAIEQSLSPHEQAMVSRPISDLNLSVRARKCLARLSITTLGELIQRSPDELLASKNFGVTSLNEIRQQLGELGLKLFND